MDLIVGFPEDAHRDTYRPKVRFGSNFDLKLVENLSHKYKGDLWFTKKEMTSFRLEAAKLLLDISSNDMTVAQYAEENIHDTSVFMGLENYMTDRTIKDIRDRKSATWKAVLSEHKRQIGVGIHDPQAIANAVEHLSKSSSKRARIIGLLHAEKSEMTDTVAVEATLGVVNVPASQDVPLRRKDLIPLSAKVVLSIPDSEAISIITQRVFELSRRRDHIFGPQPVPKRKIESPIKVNMEKFFVLCREKRCAQAIELLMVQDIPCQ